MSTTSLPHRPTRRDFLAGLAGSAVAALAGTQVLADGVVPSTQPVLPAVDGAKVVRVSSKRVIDGLIVSRARLRRMLDESLRRLTGCGNATDAWRQFIRPGSRVLLKFSRLSEPGLRTEAAMLSTLLDSLTDAGYSPEDFTVVGLGKTTLTEALAPVPAGWSQRTVSVAGVEEQVRRYLDDIDVIINVPTISDHNLAGVGCAMMNVSLPLVRRPGRFFGEDLHEAIVSIAADGNAIPPVKLTIVNAMRCIYDGGPMVIEKNIAYDNSLWLSRDMVAIDRLAGHWIDRHRRMKKLPTLAAAGRPAEFIKLAAERNVGVSELRRIIVQTHLM